VRSRLLGLGFAAALALLLGLAVAQQAQAAPTARFTATPIQQPVCVAPCAVHLDARASDDPQYTRDFHTLDYEFSCGISAAGRSPGTWQDGASRDVAHGPVTGCVYAEPGTYRVTLTVRAPDGETGTTSSDVVIANANSEFADANETWCIAASGAPGTSAFAACPNANPANHVVSASFSEGLNACGARTAHRRCLFRSGDTFAVTTSTPLSDLGGLVGAFGTGAAPLMTGSSNRGLALGDNWTVTGIQFRLTDDQGLPCGNHSDYINFGTAKDGLTVFGVTMNGLSAHGISTSSGMGAGVTHNDRIAIIDTTMNASDTFGMCGGALFLRSERTLVMGNLLDGAGRVGESTAYNFRTVHFAYGAIQHNRIRRPGPHDNNIQLRAWASTTTGPPNDPTQYVVISDNHFSAQDPTMGFIRSNSSAIRVTTGRIASMRSRRNGASTSLRSRR
jgi:PKD repeat protein